MPMKTADAMPAASRPAPTAPTPWALHSLLAPLLDSLPRRPNPDGLGADDLNQLAALVGDVVERSGAPPEERNARAMFLDRLLAEVRLALREKRASGDAERWKSIDQHLALSGSAFLSIGLVGSLASAYVAAGTARASVLALRAQCDRVLAALDGGEVRR